VIVDHGNNYFTLYGHLSEVAVHVNGRIDAGQLIGKVGETGSLTGANLYFEVREGADAPMPSIRQPGSSADRRLARSSLRRDDR